MKRSFGSQQLVNYAIKALLTTLNMKLSHFHTFTNLDCDPQQPINGAGHFSQVTFILRLAVHRQVEDHLEEKKFHGYSFY